MLGNILDWIWREFTAGVFAAIIISVLFRRTIRRHKMCSCGMVRSLHEVIELPVQPGMEGLPAELRYGRCLGHIKRPKFKANGAKVGLEFVPCPCQRYDGPVV